MCTLQKQNQISSNNKKARNEKVFHSSLKYRYFRQSRALGFWSLGFPLKNWIKAHILLDESFSITEKLCKIEREVKTKISTNPFSTYWNKGLKVLPQHWTIDFVGDTYRISNVFQLYFRLSLHPTECIQSVDHDPTCFLTSCKTKLPVVRIVLEINRDVCIEVSTTSLIITYMGLLLGDLTTIKIGMAELYYTSQGLSFSSRKRSFGKLIACISAAESSIYGARLMVLGKWSKLNNEGGRKHGKCFTYFWLLCGW